MAELYDRQMRYLVIGAHQDDPEEVGGLAIKLTRAGHVVKFLTTTDGGSGHQLYPGYHTVQTRAAEKERSRQVLGISEYESLDAQDGFLTADLANRERLMRAIRTFRPDVIITHRPWDYHPDHRNTSLLVQDCSYLARVPNFLPLLPVLDELPFIFYMYDEFRKPCPFEPAVAIAIDDVWEQKMQAFSQHESQMFDWLPWIEHLDPAPDAGNPDARLRYVMDRYRERNERPAEACRALLAERYGAEQAAKVRYCEPLEACEYGRDHREADYLRLFPC